VLGAAYDELVGAAPKDPKDGRFAERYCCAGTPTSAGPTSAGATYMSCTGKPDCNGGPLPTAAIAKVAVVPPGEKKILLKQTVKVIEENGREYLYDPTSARQARILVFASIPSTELCDELRNYCLAAGMDPSTIAFHIYKIEQWPERISASGNLIAVPVRYACPSLPWSAATKAPGSATANGVLEGRAS
jgi:hypothetical protein